MVAPCEFCSSRAAVLYCRADSAKLCLLCDQHVHSANALSIKHLRSQICDNCSAAPASVRCFTDNLFLCHDCDEDAHPAAVGAHERHPAADAFSGCPSAFDLASAWGVNIVEEEKKVRERNKCVEEEYPWGGGLLEELMVPNGDLAGFGVGDLGIGKERGVVVKQLLELVADRGGEEMRPRTPSGSGAWKEVEELVEEEEEKQGFGGGGGGEFTSLMMQANTSNFQKEEPNTNNNMLWNTNNSSDHTAQIWDFNLGRLRGQNSSGALELDFGGNDMDYVVKSYGELLKEASGTRRGLDFQGVSCSFAQEEMIPFNVTSNNPSGSQGPATSESNNMAASCSGFSRPKSYNCSKDFQFSDESILIKSESAVAMSKADLELLAKNRGNAMQRYKEKKKNRRYDKQIRYESRKARADTRKRVKGRFVKASDPPEG